MGGPGAAGELGSIWSRGTSVRGRPIAGQLPGRMLSPDTYADNTAANRVIDFSNPLTIKLERERAFQVGGRA